MSEENISPLKIAVVTVVLICVVGGFYASRTASRNSGSSSVDPNELILSVCEDFNKRCPLDIESLAGVRLTRVEAGTMQITWHYTITPFKFDPKHPEQLSAFEPVITSINQHNPSVATLFDRGVRMLYRYYDDSGKAMVEVEPGQPPRIPK